MANGIGCIHCGVMIDPELLPNYDSVRGVPGQFCPVCHNPLTPESAGRTFTGLGVPSLDKSAMDSLKDKCADSGFVEPSYEKVEEEESVPSNQTPFRPAARTHSKRR